MYVCMYVLHSAHKSLLVYLKQCIYTRSHTYTHTYIYTHIHVHTHTHIYIYICVCVCVYVCVCVRVYMCVCARVCMCSILQHLVVGVYNTSAPPPCLQKGTLHQKRSLLMTLHSVIKPKFWISGPVESFHHIHSSLVLSDPKWWNLLGSIYWSNRNVSV